MTQRRGPVDNASAFQPGTADCIFCQIVAGQRPASIVFGDPTVLAFLDVHPLTPGHLLVVPKRHVPSLAELDERTGAHVFTIAARVAATLRQDGVACEAINLFLSDGVLAGQEVLHVHLHVIPRFPGDPFGEGRPIKATTRASPSRGSLDSIAERLRATYAGLFS